MFSDNVWPAVWLYCESNDDQILLNIECSELKKWVDIVIKKTPTSSIRTNWYYLDSHFNFLFFPSSAMDASSSQPETMKAECSLDNPKVHSFFLILFTKSYILFLLHYIQCHFMAFEENFMIIWWCVPKRNIKSCQMLCTNCFHLENRKPHAMVWSCPFGEWE